MKKKKFNAFTLKSSFRGRKPEESHGIRTKRFFAPLHFALNDSKVAFTLAEVLITLTIIGVIAALTIPNLMQSWKKHERISEIKTAYSIISQAIKISIAENGSADDWGTNTIEIAEKYIIPYLKIQYSCGCFDKVLRSGCFLTSDKNPTGYFFYPTGKSNEGSGSGYGANYVYNIKLQNGMDLGIYINAKDYLSFIIDVNGSIGPTKVGSDVFGFILEKATGKVKLGYGTWYYPNQKLQTIIDSYCQAEHISSLQCTRVLELNNWDFPDNYPVKKW